MNKSLIAIGLAVGLSAIAGGCTAQQSRAAASDRQVASQWIGKDRVELAEKMGQPRQAVPTDKGGEMLFYSYQDHHYYFQTNVMGQIDSAVRTD
ncbi:MAG: hypothetical protein ACLQAT_00080 [Candidatus Binataceae bacterium]